jgi:hypothetical protein
MRLTALILGVLVGLTVATPTLEKRLVCGGYVTCVGAQDCCCEEGVSNPKFCTRRLL